MFTQNKPNILLIRHAECHANIDFKVLHTQPNMLVSLTDKGKSQALKTSAFVAEQYLNSNNKLPLKIWNSPYNRTRDTATAIKQSLTAHNISYEEEESLYLSERQFGLAEAENYTEQFDSTIQQYLNYKKDNVDFFCRPHLGESPFDVCLRVDTFIRVILSMEKDKNHIIVSHGAAIKSFILMQQKFTYETYNNMELPSNASIYHIEGNQYNGCIWKP